MPPRKRSEVQQWGGQIIAVICLKETKIADHIAVGLFLTVFDSRRYSFNEKNNFFYTRSS